MRPRVFPAEDHHVGAGQHGPLCCFNEAAGIPRGRRAHALLIYVPCGGFNEAAGIPRGRQNELNATVLHLTLQ